MTRKRKILIILGAVVVLGAIIGFSINARRKKGITVQTGKVQKSELLVSKVSASGEIKPKEYVELQSEIAGVITHLFVKEGDRVNKGDLLLKIDPVQTEAETKAQQAMLDVTLSEASNQWNQISVQETNIERDRANVRLAQTELTRSQKNLEITHSLFERKQQLFEDNLISRDIYETAKNEHIGAEAALASAQARLEQAQAQLKVSEVILEQVKTSHKAALSRVEQSRAILSRNQDLLSKTVIRSPLTGIITKLNVEVGERAVPGTLNNPSATLMEIADLSVIEAEIEVDETDIVNVKMGQEGEVKVDALPDQPLRGAVTEVGNSAITRLGQQQQEAKDFKVVIQLNDPPETLRPSLSCTAEIKTDSRRNVLTVPMQALTIREYEVDDRGRLIKPEPTKENSKNAVKAATNGDLKKRKKKEFQGVFVVSNGKARFVEVKTGIMGDTEIEVTSGLKEGMEIITGSYKTLRTLKDDDLLKIENNKEKG